MTTLLILTVGVTDLRLTWWNYIFDRFSCDLQPAKISTDFSENINNWLTVQLFFSVILYPKIRPISQWFHQENMWPVTCWIELNGTVCQFIYFVYIKNSVICLSNILPLNNRYPKKALALWVLPNGVNISCFFSAKQSSLSFS